MAETFEQKPVYIFSASPFAQLVAIVDDYATLRFKKGWYAPGNFELTINKNTRYASLFVQGAIVRVGEDNTKCGYITDVIKDIGPTGAVSEIITVRGNELTQWLDRRDILPPIGQAYYALPTTTKAETIVKDLIRDSMGSGAAASRQVASLTIVADSARGAAYTLSSRYNNLLKEVSDCLLATNTGIFATLSPSTNTWILDFTTGTDRTASIVFSTDRETTLSANLRETDVSYRNVAIVAGQGEGVDRTIRTVWTGSEPTGLDRREIFIDARDLSATASLDNRGAQKLAENVFVQFLTVDALAYSQIALGVDYFVGDKVTVTQFGVTQQVYITSAEESWKAGFYGLKLGFDRSPPTLPGQVSSIAGTASQTLARIDPVWPSTIDGTLAANSDELLPTEKAVKTYVDASVLADDFDYPHDVDCFERHTLDDTPVITYPDNPAGTTYLQDAWATVDGWTYWGGFVCTVGVSGGNLIATATSTALSLRKTGLIAPAGSTLIVRIKSSRTGPFILFTANGGTYTAFFNSILYAGAWTVIPVSPSMAITELMFRSDAAFVAGDTLSVNVVYLGDGSYTWTVGDDSGNGNSLVPHGGLTQVAGVSGKAIQFDGTTGYLSGVINGFTDKISVSFWAYLTQSAAQSVIFESSTTGVAIGNFSILWNDTNVSGRLTVLITTGAATYLDGWASVTTGLHHIGMTYDNSIVTTNAIKLYVDGVLQSLTYVHTSSVRPVIYNGPIFIGGRNGVSFMTPFWIDEIRIDKAILSAENFHALYRIPMEDTSNNTGSGPIVRATDPTISGAIPIMEAVTQRLNKTIPSGYNAVVYGTYEIASANSLTIEGSFIIL